MTQATKLDNLVPAASARPDEVATPTCVGVMVVAPSRAS